MIKAIHLVDPVKGKSMAPEFITLRCGMVRKPEETKTTANHAEVTCVKCRSYINNPYRALRKYGKVKVVESMYVIVWGDFGYRLDMVAVTEVPATWAVTIAYKNKIHLTRSVSACNMSDLGFKLLAILEKEIIELAKTNH